jgi:hypothetical protein
MARVSPILFLVAPPTLSVPMRSVPSHLCQCRPQCDMYFSLFRCQPTRQQFRCSLPPFSTLSAVLRLCLGDCYCGNRSYATDTTVSQVANEYSRCGKVKLQRNIGAPVPQTRNVLWSHNPLILELAHRRRRIVIAPSGLFSPVQNAPETHGIAGRVDHIGSGVGPMGGWLGLIRGWVGLIGG